MLVLSRKPGQAILIGDNIEIQIIEIQGEQIRIGINAPRDITFVRYELIDEVKQTNREAVVGSSHISLEDLGKVIKK